MATRLGRQTPTASTVIPYKHTLGEEAIDAYESTGRAAQEWQKLLIYDILAITDDGLYVHTKFGYSVPRRNGKNEIVAIRELYALQIGEKALHTAHRVTTSASAAARLADLLTNAGYIEITRQKKDEIYDHHFIYGKQMGLEKITLIGGGSVSFRTRTARGGLGEGFDLLIIDEAQEYGDDQETALKYVVSDSKNPQTILCGTPPTMVSTGTVFPRYRRETLFESKADSGWAEWSVDKQTDPHDVDAWYETNPSLGTILTERKIRDEIGNDEIDFNIQRLGLWFEKGLKGIFSAADWDTLQCKKLPKLTGRLHIGVKYGADGTNAAAAIACKTEGKVLVELLGIMPRRNGDAWLLDFMKRAQSVESITIDGAVGQQGLVKELKDAGCRIKPILPTVKEIITANAAFEQNVIGAGLCHMGQPVLRNAVINCDKRPIGSNGGFGYKAISEEDDVSVIEACVLALWACQNAKEPVKQSVRL